VSHRGVHHAFFRDLNLRGVSYPALKGGAPQATAGGTHPALLKSAKECSGAAGGLSFHLSAPETPSVRAGWSTPKLDI